MIAARRRSGSEGVEDQKGLFTGGEGSFYSGWRRWNESGVAAKLWARQSRGGRSWDVMSAVWVTTSR
jgi:hypothetical protein